MGYIPPEEKGLHTTTAKVRSVSSVLIVDSTVLTSALAGLHCFDCSVPFYVGRPGLSAGRFQYGLSAGRFQYPASEPF